MAEPPEVSPPLRELLRTRIDSFDKLEIVMALHAAPHTTLSIEELSTAIKIPRDLARSLCSELRDALLVDDSERTKARLLPPSETDVALLAELADLYGRDRVLLARVLSDIAMSRLRNMAARAFADAFVLRKKNGSEPDDG